jgi:hemolysin III
VPTTLPASLLALHYPHPAERSADRWIHIIGLTGAAIGGLTLLGLCIGFGRLGEAAAVGVYGACGVLMFLASMIYNLSTPGRRPFLRRLDHAAIFLMIAGSYTPFTTERLSGAWAWGMTVAVWVLALGAAGAKLFAPGLGKRVWVAVYLALGWIAVIAIKPLLADVSILALGLLLAGGLIYSLGVIVYVRKTLPFRRAIWHGFVVAAAATQFAAVLVGVVLPDGR